MKVINLYLVRSFLGFLIPILLGFIALYLIIDFFDRLDSILEHQASISATIRFFLFKVPLVITEILPAAVNTSILLSLGLMARRNEITALRASGVSLWQTAVPLILVATAISFATLAWNETIVPYSMRERLRIKHVEIQKREIRGILSDKEIWYHGKGGFYNIDHIDQKRNSLFGLTIYRTADDFDLNSIVHIDSARWNGTNWQTNEVIERKIRSGGDIETRVLDSFEIPEKLDEFLEVHRESDELSYLALRSRITNLNNKGIDGSDYLVDLNLKLAIPFISLVLTMVGIPLAGRVRRHPSVAAITGVGVVIGFSLLGRLRLSEFARPERRFAACCRRLGGEYRLLSTGLRATLIVGVARASSREINA